MVTKQAPSPWHLCPSLYLQSGHKLSGIFQLWDFCIYHALCWITVWLILLHSSSLLSLLHCDGFLILKAGPCHLLHPDPASFSLEPWVLDTAAWLLVTYSSNLVCPFLFSWYALKGERDPLFEGSLKFFLTWIPVHEPLANWPLDTGSIDAHVYFLCVEIKQSWESISCSGFCRCLASWKEKMASPIMWLPGLSRFLPSLPGHQKPHHPSTSDTGGQKTSPTAILQEQRLPRSLRDAWQPYPETGQLWVTWKLSQWVLCKARWTWTTINFGTSRA